MRLALWFAALALACDNPSAGTCPGEVVPPAHVRVVVGSSLDGAGALTPGDRLRCLGADPARLVASLEAARLAMPKGLRPEALVVHLDPRMQRAAQLERIEVHQESGGLLLAGDPDLEASVFHHELAHVIMRGARPTGQVAVRLVRAIEEGVADYVAATVADSPVLGGGSDGRDLRRPPQLSTFSWAALALPQVRFDGHVLGWQLAAVLWRADRGGGALREDLVAALADRSLWPTAIDSPAETLEHFLARCPERSRARIADLLHAWSPPQLATVRLPGG